MASRDLIWRGLLGAELNAGYYKELSDRYVFQDNSSRYLGLVFGSSALISLPFWASIPLLWQGLLFLNSLFSLATFVFKIGEKARTAKELSTKWKILSQHYDLLWTQINEETCRIEYIGRYESLLRDEAELIKVACDLPTDEVLRERHTNLVVSLRASGA